MENFINVIFDNKEEIDDIVGYFDSLKGVTAFNFTIPDSNASGTPKETILKVVCEDFSTSGSEMALLRVSTICGMHSTRGIGVHRTM